MQYLIDFFSFVNQCADAEKYLEIGKLCAETGDCYDSSRPMGAVYWFSLPYRLDLSPSVTLIAGHLLLMLVSVILSVIAMHRLTEKFLPSACSKKTLYLFFLGSLIVHTVFLYPVFRISYSDAPASLFALMAFWLFLIIPVGKPEGFLIWMVIGLCLGLSAWIRSFFLYPVLAVLVMWSLLWLLPKNRKIIQLGLLVALLPIGIQIYTTWQRTGFFAYIDPQVTNRWGYAHLTDRAIGFDLTSPAQTRWYSSCKQYTGLLSALKTYDMHSLSCLYSGKFNFYAGSYSDVVCRDMGVAEYVYGPNLLLAWNNADNINDADGHLVNMKRDRAVAPGVNNEAPADRLTRIDAKSYGEIYQTVELQSNVSPYAFSTWIWSGAESCVINMAIRNNKSRELVSSKNFQLSPENEVKSVEAIIMQPGLYDVVIGSEASCSDSIYLWEEFDLRLVQHSEIYKNPDNIRVWSKWILIVNLGAFGGAILLLIRMRKNLDVVQWLAPFFMLLAFMEALTIIPEQRFAMAPIIAASVLFMIWIVIAFTNKLKKYNHPS